MEAGGSTVGGRSLPWMWAGEGFLEHPWSKVQDHPSRQGRDSRCLCYAFPGGDGRCLWCSLGCFSQRGCCPCMSPYAGHGKVLGLGVVGGRRPRAVFWQVGGSRRLLEQHEARKGVAYRPARARCDHPGSRAWDHFGPCAAGSRKQGLKVQCHIFFCTHCMVTKVRVTAPIVV